jgi:CBS domain-containing protein
MQTAKEIMTTEVVSIQASASVAEAIALMRSKQVRDLMVEPSHKEDAHGIVTDTDIAYKVAAYGKDPKTITVGDIMTKPCIEVDPDLTVEEVAQLFALNHLHRAPVIKEKLLGVISITDILRETMWWQG